MKETPEVVEVQPDVALLPASTRPNVGVVVLRAAIVLISASLLLSILLGILGAPYVVRDPQPHFNFSFGDPNPTISALALASPIHGLLGSLVGIWVVVQSIVAISVNRGRRSAIIALVLAVIAPGLSLLVYLLIMLLPR